MTRRFLKATMLFFVIGSSLFASSIAWGNEALAGDIDGDGVVDAMDVQLVINGALSFPGPYSTDIDYSGKTDAMDVQLVINAALSIPIDIDKDGLCERAEIHFGTLSNNPDTDGDGVSDGQEVRDGTDPLVPNDPVPNVVGMSQADAESAITAAGLTVGAITQTYSDTVPEGSVISQTPAGGSHVPLGSAVALVISIGPVPSLGWSYVVPTSTVFGLTIEETADHGVIMGGGFNAAYDMHALKLTANGQYDWGVTYSESSPGASGLWRSEARGLRQTSDGGYIMLGGNGYVLLKLDSQGNKVWSKEYAPENPYSPGHDCSSTESRSLWVCSDGGYFAVGSSYVGGYYLASVLKTDANGNELFCKVINDNAKAYDQTMMDGQQTTDGGYVLTGYSSSNPHGYTALLIKLNATGALEWSSTFQDVANDHGAESYAVAQTPDGGYIIGGEELNSITKVATYGCWLAKVDSNGNQVWLRSYGHSLTVHYPNDLAVAPNGDIIAVGHKGVYMDLSKFDASGNVVWNYDFGGLTTSIGNALTLTEDGGCVVVGSGNSGGGTVVVKVAHVYTP